MRISIAPGFMPSKIVCVGRNYAEHAAEMGNDLPIEPLLFLKASSALGFTGQPIVIPDLSQQVEYEGELGVVIAKTCKDLGEGENITEYIKGYTCVNDVTARDLQRRDGQFARAKSFDTFCPIGPHIETDLDPRDIRIVTRLNGVSKQDARTYQMVFSVDYLIRYISRMMTLHADDIIATGTPSGVSRMVTGDVCEVEIEGIGVLTNPVL
jgi:2-keto-4-pentenoate hydratase/2-oxohepta-3-ene-1,7-dioic acid hydratase in catechol pathway